MICDGQVLLGHERVSCREKGEAGRLSLSQLILGLQRISPGVLLHKLEAFNTADLLHTISIFGTVKLYKSAKYHAKRSSFYLSASNIQSIHSDAILALSTWKQFFEVVIFGSDDQYETRFARQSLVCKYFWSCMALILNDSVLKLRTSKQTHLQRCLGYQRIDHDGEQSICQHEWCCVRPCSQFSLYPAGALILHDRWRKDLYASITQTASCMVRGLLVSSRPDAAVIQMGRMTSVAMACAIIGDLCYSCEPWKFISFSHSDSLNTLWFNDIEVEQIGADRRSNDQWPYSAVEPCPSSVPILWQTRNNYPLFWFSVISCRLTLHSASRSHLSCWLTSPDLNVNRPYPIPLYMLTIEQARNSPLAHIPLRSRIGSIILCAYSERSIP